MIYIPIILSLTLLIIDLVKNKKILAPGVVFNAVTFITLFLYSFQLSYIQHTLLWQTVLLLTLCIVAFNVPVFLGYFVKREPKSDKAVVYRDYDTSKKADLILFIIIVVIFSIEVIYNCGVPLLWKLLGTKKTYMDFSFFKLHGIFMSLLLTVGFYSLFKKNCPYKWIYLLIPILLISRQYLISILIEGLVLYLLSMKRRPKHLWLWLVGFVVVGIVAFGVIGNFRTGKAEFLYVAQFKAWADWVPSALKWVYSYICFSIANLNKLVGLTNGFENFGASTLTGILGIPIPENASYDYLVSPNFTVSTFMPSLYLDFGMLGPILFCLVIGMVSIWVYKRLSVSKIYLMFYAIIVHNLIFLYFTNMFLYRPIFLQVIYILIIFVLPQTIQRRKNERNNLGGGKRHQTVSVDGGDQ